MAKSARSKPKVRVLSSRKVFAGPVFHVTSDRLLEPSGVKVRRDVVHHPGSVVILPVDESRAEPRVLLERQYRYAAREFLWELPAGSLDEGEDPLKGAKRELLEETGYTAAHWKRILKFYVSPGVMDETMSVFLATGLERGKAQPEDDEVIQKRMFLLSAAVRMVERGVIRDAKTIASVLWLAIQKL